MNEFGAGMFLFGLWIGLNLGIEWGQVIGKRFKKNS